MNPIARIRTPLFLCSLIIFMTAILIVFLAAGHQAAATNHSHTPVYFRIIDTIWIALVLVSLGLCFFIGWQRNGHPSNIWIVVWTFAYLAYLVHFYCAAGTLFHWNFGEIFHSHLGENSNPEKVVEKPIPDLVLTGLWGFDVFLAWCVTSNPRWLRIEHILMSLFVLIVFVGAALAAKAGPVTHILGYFLVTTVTATGVLHFALWLRRRRNPATQGVNEPR